MRVVNTKEMAELEKQALEQFGLEESLIIENVGIRGAAHLYREFLSNHRFGEIVLLIGKGNNGADGLAIGRHLREYGLRVRAFMIFDRSECSQELKRQAKIAHGMGVKITDVNGDPEQIKDYFQGTQDEYFVIDAIFGMGIRLPLPNSVYHVIKAVNQFSTICVALDIPSGITGDTGRSEGMAIEADHTLAVGVPKVGYYSKNGAKHTGEITIISAGLPRDLIRHGNKNVINLGFISKILGRRNKFAHKNSFGHTLVVGGAHGMAGALVLAANGALRVGSGLVTAATWQDSYDELSMKINPEIMSYAFPRSSKYDQDLMDRLDYFDSVVVGPGLGRDLEAQSLVKAVLMNFSGPVVLDADAIHCLKGAEGRELLKGRKGPVIMTPHLGEFAAFVGKTVRDVEEAPVDNLRALLDETGAYITLKGPGTYVGLPTGEIYINYAPNVGMATGGSGDVLAGIIGGLLSQAVTKNQSFNPKLMDNEWGACVTLGVFVHSLAGLHAAQENGVRAMTAWSIIGHLHRAFSDIQKQKQKKKGFAAVAD